MLKGIIYQKPKFIIKKNAINALTRIKDFGAPNNRTFSARDL